MPYAPSGSNRNTRKIRRIQEKEERFRPTKVYVTDPPTA
jgi:hypothetical protein